MLTCISRVFNAKKVRLALVFLCSFVLVKIRASKHQGNPGVVIVEVLAIQLEELNNKNTKVSRWGDFHSLDFRMHLQYELR